VTPWRKRLKDLRQLIYQADQTYFEPDLFRLNVNNAIQTARTVTFMIQKNKAEIKDFDSWYNKNVLEPFKKDRIMEWLKDSRNHIEKQGDLDINSRCDLETIFSYTDRGPRMSLKNVGHLFIGTKKLIRMIRKIFPTGIYRESAIAIDRRWIAASLPDIELTDALHYGYSELLRVVDALDRYVGEEVTTIPLSPRFGRGSASRRSYLKTENGEIYSYTNSQFQMTSADAEQVEKRYDVKPFVEAFRSTSDLKLAHERFSELASDVYERDGYHITLLVLLDKNGEIIGLLGPHFDHRTDKLIFWIELARAADIDSRINGVIFISELWFRSLKGFPQKKISVLEITGEGLQIVAADRTICLIKTIPVVKDSSNARPRLDRSKAEIETGVVPNFLVPLRKAWEARDSGITAAK
jgi:hypothetical protein